jgi:hypothetical protein
VNVRLRPMLALKLPVRLGQLLPLADHRPASGIEPTGCSQRSGRRERRVGRGLTEGLWRARGTGPSGQSARRAAARLTDAVLVAETVERGAHRAE